MTRSASGAAGEAAATGPVAGDVEDPDEAMERLWRARRQLVAGELLERIGQASPAFFEQLVVRLLVAMGYGGSYAEASQVVGRSGDEGIDGIIKEDRLGLDAIYVTTSSFSPGARAYVDRIDKRIVLIDGPMLADLMIEHGVGVAPERTYTIPRVDTDFFEPE